MFHGECSWEKLFFPEMFYETAFPTFPSFPKIKLLCDISNCIILEDQIKHLEKQLF